MDDYTDHISVNADGTGKGVILFKSKCFCLGQRCLTPKGKSLCMYKYVLLTYHSKILDNLIYYYIVFHVNCFSMFWYGLCT